jgi:hypothetical protein
MSFIQSNSQDEKVVVSPKYFWGLRNVRPIALNPTKQELIDLGINTDKEPEYLKLVENVITASFRFWVSYMDLKGEEKKSFVSFNVTDKEFVSKTGKTQFIDIAGNTSWAVDIDSISETSIKYGFDVKTARPAFLGEEGLVNFLKVWFNVKPGSPCRPDDYKKEFEGKFANFKSLFKDPNSKNELTVLFAATASKGNVYSNIYSGYFQRASVTGLSNWSKHIANQRKYYATTGKPFPLNFPDNYVFSEIPEEVVSNLITASLQGEEETPATTGGFSTEAAGF